MSFCTSCGSQLAKVSGHCAQCGSEPGEEATSSVAKPTSAAPSTEPTNALATASLVLGLIAIMVSITIVLGIILGVLAVIFGLIGLKKSSFTPAKTNRKKAIAGTALGWIALVLSGLTLYAVKNEVNTVIESRNISFDAIFCDIDGVDVSVRWTGGGTRDVTFEFQAVGSDSVILWREEKTFKNIGAESYKISIDFPPSVASGLFECPLLITNIE